ncbi:twin-arginine translocation signal domain-containing protein [Natronorubrum texcoconense]|uniref:Tat (Twin-arginine translocation) pathway signal sequence n=1 Tax=Natronorubrum texcoconense TaxID=1095776 RepID=A0A1G8YJG7_9EURY|nr:twin-arginine translocation signal domain-containing protein [Natronorubrum texcoconense]SDK02787.1 Tat (twin-arginine translocation) pathway signal sequence [Natronorubrum texcoconense]
MTLSRRDVLKLAGATTAVTVTGPAVVAQEDPDDDLPAYGQWLTLEDGALEFAYLDWGSLGEVIRADSEEIDPGEEIPPEYEADPMIGPVSEGALSTYLFVGLSLGQFRLGRLLEEAAFESTVEGLLQTPAAFVVTGDLIPEEIDEQLTAEPEAEFIRQFESTGEIAGADVYTPADGTDDAAIAVDEDALVVAAELGSETEPTTTLETTVGAAAGDVERATEESETFEWLLESAGGGDVAVGQYGDPSDPEFTFDGLEDAEAIVSSLTAADAETATGEFAAIVDDPDEAVLEEIIGISADERSLDVDGDRVTATGTWREDVTVTAGSGSTD